MVSILNNNEKLTTYAFYSRFLKDVALEIREHNDISFKLVENGDDLIYDSSYSIEPITIPLLLSLCEQLSKFYNKPIDLSLFNNLATQKVLNFLYKSDFFYIAGNNENPYFPKGRNLLKFQEKYLGDFISVDPRPEHRIRCYSLVDHNLSDHLENYSTEDDKRDFLISEYVYIVREHFQELLFDNSSTADRIELYVEILSELITNGVLHSKSNTFALMFVNKFATKFSISDNGIGFAESLKNKKGDSLYQPFQLKEKLDKLSLIKLNKKIEENLTFIIETLYYSSLKDRKGLFDLMLSVVLNSKGYFRLHCENAQIIISNRMSKELQELSELRAKLFDFYRKILINNNSQDFYIKEMQEIKDCLQQKFVYLYMNICQKYNDDFRYSSIRFFNVRFRGVHIEVEIPNNQI